MTHVSIQQHVFPYCKERFARCGATLSPRSCIIPQFRQVDCYTRLVLPYSSVDCRCSRVLVLCSHCPTLALKKNPPYFFFHSRALLQPIFPTRLGSDYAVSSSSPAMGCEVNDHDYDMQIVSTPPPPSPAVFFSGHDPVLGLLQP